MKMKKRSILLICFALFALIIFSNLISAEENISITKFIPTEFKVGDVQFNIQVQNNENNSIENIFAIVTGNGFSTYDVIPIEILAPEDKDYIFIIGNFKNPGEINLSIKINNKIFYQKVSVIGENNTELEDLIKKQEETNKILNNLSIELSILKENYSNLENEIADKKENNYDVSKINLDDLKRYLRNAEASILGKDVENAQINIDLAEEEFSYQKSKINNLKKIPLLSRIKENSVLFTAIAGALIMIFTLYELLKNKSEKLVSSVKFRKKKEETEKS